MCGVFGYIGETKKDLFNYLINNLANLEYRGYDSAGIAVISSKNKVHVAKSIGEIDELKKITKNKGISSGLGIGHTRWATHGGVTEENAHPHLDCERQIVVVHNGIIENFKVLKQELTSKGHTFNSDTDTEVFAHLVEEELGSSKVKLNKKYIDSVRKAFLRLDGLNAVVVLFRDAEIIVAFRKGSPLVAGKGKDANFISSDIPTLIDETNSIVFMDEDEGVLLYPDKIEKIDLKTGKISPAKTQKVKMDTVVQDKGNFEHYLLKEIYEQPEVIARIANYEEKEINEAANMIRDAWGTYFTACGTAAHAGLAATYMFSEIAKRHVNFAVGSEFPYLEEFLVDRSLLIAASQSGETMDTLEAVRAAKIHSSKVLSLVNVPGSSLTRLSDKSLLLKAGPEKSVLSTKAYVAKLSMFLLLAYTVDNDLDQGRELLRQTSEKLSKILNKKYIGNLKKISKNLIDHKHIFVIGRGFNYPTALEGALKIKEASYIHAEGFAGGELKHGVIALIEEGTPCIAVVANDEAKEATLSNAIELSSRGASIIGISPENNDEFDHWISVPDVGNASPLVNVVPMQLLAYYLTVAKGLDPDKPRNLAKSVTVK